MTDETTKTESAPATAKPYRRVIDLGDGAGQEVFEADEPLEFTPSQEKYIDKLVDAKRNASMKIRQQEQELRKNENIGAFVAEHDDYENEGETGRKNGELMRMRLAELGLPVTPGNLHTAYSHLKEKGLLKLKSDEPERPAPSGPIPTPQRTKKVTSIGTQNRATATPVNTEPSEYDLYHMPQEKLRELANKQLAGRN